MLPFLDLPATPFGPHKPSTSSKQLLQAQVMRTRGREATGKNGRWFPAWFEDVHRLPSESNPNEPKTRSNQKEAIERGIGTKR